MNLLPAVRVLLAAPFIADGADALLRPTDHVARVQRAGAPLTRAGLPTPPDCALRLGSRVMGAVSLASGLGLAAGAAPRACAVVLAGINVPVTLVNAPLWLAGDAEERARHLSFLTRGAAIGAGLALMALTRPGGDTPTR